MPRPELSTTVQVNIRHVVEHGGREVERRFIKRLDENFWTMPAPGDLVHVEGEHQRVVPSAVGEDGTITTVTETSGAVIQIQLNVLRRLWTAHGVTLVTEPWSPLPSSQDPVDIMAALQEMGFREFSEPRPDE